MTLHFDCFAGISGDMTLGALAGLGVNAGELCSELKKLDISEWSLDFIKEERCGISGLQAVVKDCSEPQKRHSHTRWSEIRKIIETSAISAGAKNTACAIFERLAEAEAEAHQVSVEDVSFHEVGAVDSIIDIVGAAVCLDILKPDKITAGEVELGGGTVQCAHGILPVPAPATLILCKNMPVRSGGFNKEMTTPTGAAILAVCVDEFLYAARWKEIKTAYGIGRRKLEKPNVLRVSLREEGAGTVNSDKEIVVLETNIDDMTAEALGFLMESLLEAGALDVTLTPCIMKKSRPATIVSVLCDHDKLDVLRAALFRRSSTLGVREYPVRRYALARKMETLNGARIKRSFFENCVKEKIEYDDRALIAREKDMSLDEAEKFFRGQK
jgi:uncharacterized protein (TIGR00299 family) protein